MTSESNKRIAKNTVMLYFRMLLIMAVSLYTSRIVLKTLGVEDFGIYNVVGGFVTMFGFLNSAMASATQRFLAFEIGRNDKIQLRNVFSMSVNIHFLIAFLILILAETVGLWFVNTQLTIPPERMLAARWVYQFSILTLMVNMVSVPYNAIIIANERMNVFAWVSIVEVGLKLFIVFMLQWFGFDKLKLYAVLMFGVALLIRLIYGLYCGRKFKESRFRIYWDKPLFKILINYAGWNLWGNAAFVLMGQGVNVLLNIFFGPVVNAAYGVTYRISGALNQFVTNFQMAMNPQIIKSYAKNDLNFTHQLIYQGSRFSFFLLLIISLPILLETEVILRIWLKTVPDYTANFVRLSIINILIESSTRPLRTAAQASGKIKTFQGVVGGLLMLNLPLSYLFLKLGYPPESTFYISIGVALTAFYAQLKIVAPLVKMNIFDYLKKVIVKITLVFIVAIILPLSSIYLFDESSFRLIFTGSISLLSTILTTYRFGLMKSERQFIFEKLKQINQK